MDCILEKFAGPPDTGIFSPSVQLTIYDTEKLALTRVLEVSVLGLFRVVLSCTYKLSQAEQFFLVWIFSAHRLVSYIS